MSEGTFLNIIHLRGGVFDWCIYFSVSVKEMRNNCTLHGVDLLGELR